MAQPNLRPLLEPAVQASGCDLEELTVSLAGKRRRIEVIIDRDGGVDLDLIAEVSRAVSAALDASDVGDAPYVLEVTSPGVDRPLTEARHWRRNIGRLVEAHKRDGSAVTGRVREATDAYVVLDVEGDLVEVPLADIAQGRVQIEFRRAEEGS